MDILTSHQQKALNFKDHISLTANAGSGKTLVLSHRYVEIALSEKGSLRKIAAITFTDKAASELYRKIAENLETRFKNSRDKEEKKLLSSIRRQLVSANISTIHSFCIDILRQFPVEAGLDANFQAVDEITSDEMIELSVEEIIKESLLSRDYVEHTKYLIRFFRSRFNFALQLKSLIKERKKVFEVLENIYDQNEDDVAGFFYKTFLEITDRLFLMNQHKLIDALTLINNTVLSVSNDNVTALQLKKQITEFGKTGSIEKKIELYQLIRKNILTGKGTIRDRGYLTGSNREKLSREILISEKYIGELSAFGITGDHTETERELAKFGKTMLRFFSLAISKYESKKRENGYLDYEDILILTKNLLKIPSVREDLSRKFSYIMVDEYQDTNEIQYRIFLPILDDLREGNLFVVGDEKQSIYMFRDADLEVFRLTKEKIGSASGSNFLLSLPDSFRMAPGICIFVNKLFRNLFSEPNDLFNEVNHSDLVCAKQENTESLIELLIGASDENSKDGQAGEMSEAGLVAGRIISLVKGDGTGNNLNWQDIAVLVRKRKSFSSLEKIFIEKNIPFNIVGGKGFYQRQSIYDIYNYFSFLLDTKNDTALVGILRSPFFSFPDSLIYELSLENGETLWQKLNSGSGRDDRIRKAIKVLKADLEAAPVYNSPRLLRRILEESPYMSVLSQKASGSQETANISKLIRLTIDFQKRGFKTLYDYVNFLKDSIEETEDEAQAAIADESDSVKVMTIHQAKGLEYPAVFLYNAHETTVSDKVKKGVVQIDKNFGLLTKVPLNNDYFGEYQTAPINNLFDFISSKREAAELKRLFYVAVTRAKNYLFISAPAMDKYRSGSFMELLQDGLNVDFSDESFRIIDELQFLKKEDDKFLNFSEMLEKEIKIIRNLPVPDLQVKDQPEEAAKRQVLISTVMDTPEGEIISATKFAVFKQCPLKYSLTYELGISGLAADYRRYLLDKWSPDKTGFEFNYGEDLAGREDEKVSLLPAELKGSIIHEILQKNDPDITPEEVTGMIREKYRPGDAETIKKAGSEIFDQLKGLFDSEIYRQLNVYKKFYNEYEIYLNEYDFYLHGIIDKLIIEGRKAIIIDYKTDAVAKEEINKRADLYFPQLKFYSYIVSRLFKELTVFELRLIFLNFPGENVEQTFSRGEAAQFSEEVRAMVRKIRMREFDKNLQHCNDCNFALMNSKCMVEQA